MADSNVVQEWLISLGFKVDSKQLDNLNKNLDKTKKKVSDTSGSIKNALGTIDPRINALTQRVEGFGAAATSATGSIALFAAGLAAAGAGVIALTKNLAFNTFALSKQAEQFRVTAAQLDDFMDRAEILDIDTTAAVDSLKSLDRIIAETSVGIGRGKILFEKLGISVKNSDGSLRSTLDVLDEMQGKLAKMGRGPSIALMEKAGLDPAILRMFSEEKAYIDQELAAIDKAAGFSFDELEKNSLGFVKTWRKAKTEVNLFSKTLSVKAEELGSRLMVTLGPFIEIFGEAVKRIRSTISDMGVGGLVSGFAKIVGSGILVFVTGLINTLNAMLGLWNKTPGVLKIVGAAILGVLAAWKLLSVAIKMSPVGRLIASVVLLSSVIGALIEDYEVWAEGGNSLFGNNWLMWVGVIDIMTNGIAALADTVMVAVHSFMALFTAMEYVFSGFDEGVGSRLDARIASLKTSFSSLQSNSLGAIGGAEKIALGAGSSLGSNISQVQTTNINVIGSANAADTARAVAGEQNKVNKNLQRAATVGAR